MPLRERFFVEDSVPNLKIHISCCKKETLWHFVSGMFFSDFSMLVDTVLIILPQQLFLFSIDVEFSLS